MAYLLLVGITVLICVGVVLVLRKTRQWSFLVGMSILYFWTFLGAWFFIGDALSGYQGYKIGLGYYYLMEKMFPFELDHCYLVSLAGYGLFTLAILAGVLFMSRSPVSTAAARMPMLQLDHRIFMLVAVIASICSFILVRPLVLLAFEQEESIYLVTRSTAFAGSTLHAIFNEMAVFSVLLGWSFYLSSKRPRYFSVHGQAWAAWAYPVLLICLELYLMMLGNKHELVMAMVLGTLLFFVNSVRPDARRLVLYLGLCMIPLFITGKIRGASLQEISSLEMQKAPEVEPFSVPIIEHVPRGPKPTGFVMRLGQAFLSNEMFAAHFSLYGICREEVQPVQGVSAKYLVASVIPRVLKADRPASAYDEYAAQAGLVVGQGYTIHQAAGWYMNGGWVMVAIGGLFLGLIWGLLMRWSARPIGNSITMKVISIMGTSCWIAYLPILVRDGPETFKALLVEGFGIPIAVVLLSATVAKMLRKEHVGSHGA